MPLAKEVLYGGIQHIHLSLLMSGIRALEGMTSNDFRDNFDGVSFRRYLRNVSAF